MPVEYSEALVATSWSYQVRFRFVKGSAVSEGSYTNWINWSEGSRSPEQSTFSCPSPRKGKACTALGRIKLAGYILNTLKG